MLFSPAVNSSDVAFLVHNCEKDSNHTKYVNKYLNWWRSKSMQRNNLFPNNVMHTEYLRGPHLS